MFRRLVTGAVFLLVLCLSPICDANKVEAEPEEANVHLICTGAQHPPKWYKDNATVETDDKKYVVVGENKTLIVLKANGDTMGVYVCNDTENSFSQSITLIVHPYVKPFEKSKNLIQDDPLQLECKGYGYPTPSVQWYHGDVALYPDGNRITVKNTAPSSDSKEMLNGTIRVNLMTYDDAGDYHCVATNEYGRFSNQTINVRVKDKLAALWPFLGICAEVAILCAIIFIYEKRRAKRMEREEKSAAEEAERLNSNNDAKVSDDVRQRK